MRVLQLGPFPPPHGGVQTNLVAIRNHLRSHGHGAPVINITRNRNAHADADEVFYPKNASQTARLLWRVPADIIHLHLGGNLTPRLLGLCWLSSCLPRRKTVLTFHSGGYPSSPRGRSTGGHSMAAFVLRRLDALIAVNGEIATFFRRCGVDDQRIHMISPYSFESATVPPDSQLANPRLLELDAFWQTHRPVLLSVGLLEPEYNLPLQIAVLGRVRERHPNAGLIMIGSGSFEAELRARVAAQPWAGHLLLSGDMPHAATLQSIRKCDVFVRTTSYDGDSLSVREALEMGKPVIATNNAMRPPGCCLIPAPAVEPLLEAIEQVLAEARGATSAARCPGPAVGSRNLDTVLELYQSLLA